jgi:hypothetical protein
MNKEAARTYETSAQRRNDKNFGVTEKDFTKSIGNSTIYKQFPSMDKDLIDSTLEAFDGNQEKTIRYLQTNMKHLHI